MKDNFLTIINDELTGNHSEDDPFVPRTHSINIVLEFIGVAITTARHNISDNISQCRNNTIDSEPLIWSPIAIRTFALGQNIKVFLRQFEYYMWLYYNHGLVVHL